MRSPPASKSLPSASPRRLTLRIGLPTAFVSMVLVTAVVLCGLLMSRMHEIMRADIRERIRDVVSMAAYMMDGDLHRQIKGRQDEDTPAFKDLKHRVQMVKQRVPDLRFAYTIKRNERNELFYWIDAETDPGEGSHVGDPVTTTTPTMFKAFEDPSRIWVDEAFYTDEWGQWLSGYAPVFASDGTLECMQVVDISAVKIADSERAALLVLASSATVITLIVAILGVLLSTRIVRPLSLLEHSMSQVRELNLDDGVQVNSRFREIVQMRETLQAMKSGLRSFAKYVPTALVRELIRNGEEATLGGRRAELTIFFSDIEGFTTLAEASSAEALAADLAEYFALITGTILESGGTVDKYIGDAVMAFWGAPSPVEDHPVRAVSVALQVRDRLAAMNARRVREGRAPLNTRIGLATGEVVVGNFGYEARLNYTVMGDVANLASRLEGLNKYVGTTILMSQGTANRVGDAVLSRRAGTIAVKGKNEAIDVLEPLALASEATPEQAAEIAAWNVAVEAFGGREFTGALPVFEAWSARHPDDKLAGRMVEICAEYIAEPPGEGWSATVVMQSK